MGPPRSSAVAQLCHRFATARPGSRPVVGACSPFVPRTCSSCVHRPAPTPFPAPPHMPSPNGQGIQSGGRLICPAWPRPLAHLGIYSGTPKSPPYAAAATRQAVCAGQHPCCAGPHVMMLQYLREAATMRVCAHVRVCARVCVVCAKGVIGAGVQLG